VKREDFELLTAACAKCGTCRTVCTLYPERKSEISVARGKITLVEAASSGLDGNTEAIQEALSDCLLCGRCERGCPNQVLVEEIIMKGRAALAEELGIPAWKQVVFGKMMPSSAAKEVARKAGAAAQKLLLRKVPTGSGLHYRFPEKFGFEGRTVPGLPGKSFRESLEPGEAVRGEVILFVGCVFDYVFPGVGRAAYETLLLSGKGISVYRGEACCGLPALVSGDRSSALRSIEENVRRLSDASPERIVFPCGSCLLMFRRNILDQGASPIRGGRPGGGSVRGLRWLPARIGRGFPSSQPRGRGKDRAGRIPRSVPSLGDPRQGRGGTGGASRGGRGFLFRNEGR